MGTLSAVLRTSPGAVLAITKTVEIGEGAVIVVLVLLVVAILVLNKRRKAPKPTEQPPQSYYADLQEPQHAAGGAPPPPQAPVADGLHDPFAFTGAPTSPGVPGAAPSPYPPPPPPPPPPPQVAANPPPGTPAGWLPEPSGAPDTLRYWDGFAWTQHVAQRS
jgi:hypothetical protein